eukprot:4363888-Amphidinium_carterae.1
MMACMKTGPLCKYVGKFAALPLKETPLKAVAVRILPNPRPQQVPGLTDNQRNLPLLHMMCPRVTRYGLFCLDIISTSNRPKEPMKSSSSDP